jgi:hypothetical protein
LALAFNLRIGATDSVQPVVRLGSFSVSVVGPIPVTGKDFVTKTIADDGIRDQLAKNLPPQAACNAVLAQILERGARDHVTMVLAAASA